MNRPVMLSRVFGSSERGEGLGVENLPGGLERGEGGVGGGG